MIADAPLDAKAAVEALAELARTLAHDLNQPLAAASNYLAVARHAARKQAPGPPALAESLEKAASQVTRASEAVRRMQAALAPGAPERTAQSLHAILRRACAPLESGERKVDLRLDAAEDSVLADAGQIENVLSLLLRAARRSPGAGEDSAATVATASDGVAIHAEVAGPGSGRSPPDAAAPAANALEWLIARRILETHGGSLDRPAAGGAFRLTLPLARPGEA